ncbi:hypothetical protein AAHC03_0293 [Spirometra sp. Aus1]
MIRRQLQASTRYEGDSLKTRLAFTLFERMINSLCLLSGSGPARLGRPSPNPDFGDILDGRAGACAHAASPSHDSRGVRSSSGANQYQQCRINNPRTCVGVRAVGTFVSAIQKQRHKARPLAAGGKTVG